MSQAPQTMQACVIKGPGNVVVEQRPMPKVKESTDVVVKIALTALCGSDLHFYRGHQATPHYDFVIGHEFIGEVYEVGPDVKDFKVGDKVVSPFTSQCGNCFYCSRGHTSRCVKSKVFGSVLLDGVQAEYCLVPLADTTLVKAPPGLAPEVYLLMADIFPTGYFVASNAFTMLNEPKRNDSVALVIGCGPVGLCAITAAKSMFGTVFATDPVEERRKQAEKHGAIALPESELKEAMLKASDGRGPDACLEVVGHPTALNLAIDLVRPWGIVSSCGIHTHEIQIKGPLLYNKNIRFQFGRCPVRSLFPKALELLMENGELFKSFIQNKVPLSEAPKYYELFAANKVLKTVFVPGS